MFAWKNSRRRNKDLFRSAAAEVSCETLEHRQLLSVAQPTMLGPSGSTPDTTPTISWTQVTGASRVELWVNRLNNNGTLAQSKIVHQTRLPANATKFTVGSTAVVIIGQNTDVNPTSLPQGRYRAWVVGYDSRGIQGSWSRPLDFSVKTVAKAVITGPAASLNSQQPVITWARVTGATRLEIWVNRLDASGRTLEQKVIYNPNMAGHATQFRVGTDGGPASLTPGRYRVWVQGHNGAARGDWSTARDFVVLQSLSTPVFTGPRSTANTAEPVITWTGVSGATRIELWLNRINQAGQTLESPVILVRNLPGSATQFRVGRDGGPSQLADGRYRVWVKAVNDVTGQTSGWNRFLDFQVAATGQGNTDSRPVITSPTGGIIYNTTPTIRWQGVDGAAWYRIVFNHDSGDFGGWGEVDRIVDQSLSNTTREFTPRVGLPNGYYHVAVEAVMPNGVLRVSDQVHFTINVSTEMGSGVRGMERKEAWTPERWLDGVNDSLKSSRRDGRSVQDYLGTQVWDTFGFLQQTVISRVEWWGLYAHADVINIGNLDRGTSFAVQFWANTLSGDQVIRNEVSPFLHMQPRIAGFTKVRLDGSNLLQTVPIYQFTANLRNTLTIEANRAYRLSIVSLTDNTTEDHREFNWLPSAVHRTNTLEDGWSRQQFFLQYPGAIPTRDYSSDRAFTLF